LRTSDFDPEAVRDRRDQMLIRLLFQATNAMNRELTRRLQARGWNRFQPSFPRLLSQVDTDGTSISRLAERLGTSRQAISQLARSVEEAGLIERVPHPTDGRSVVLRQTPDGRRQLIAVLEILDEMESEYAALIGKRRFAELKRLLDELLEQIDPGGKLAAR
jgi:DNA-binding MarR family transcriptional regulator